MIWPTWLRWNKYEQNLARILLKIGEDVDGIVVTSRNIFLLALANPTGYCCADKFDLAL